MAKNEEKNSKKTNNKIKTSLFIIFLIILAIGVSTGVFAYLQKINKRDNANSLVYLGIMQDGRYYAQDVPKDIRFQVDSEDASLYNITSTNGEQIPSKIVKSSGKKFIQADRNYDEGKTYILELSEGINFTDEALKNARKLEFKITRKEVAEYELTDNVKKTDNDIQIQEKDGNQVISITNTDYKVNDIIFTNDNAYKIKSIDDNDIAIVVKPALDEIYKSINYYNAEKINFDNIKINKEFEDQIILAFKETSFFKGLQSVVYADEITPTVRIIPNGAEILFKISIDLSPEKTKCLDIKSLDEHGVKFDLNVKLKAEAIKDIQGLSYINFGINMTEEFDLNIDIYSKSTIFEGIKDLSDDEYMKSVQEIIQKIESAENDSTSGKAHISGIEVPTPIEGINVYMDIYLQTLMEMQLNLAYNQKLTLKQSAGILYDGNSLSPYSNISSPDSSISFEALGKANMEFGLGFDIGISLVSKDFAHIGIGEEIGFYTDVFSTCKVDAKTGDTSSTNMYMRGKMEAGIYNRVKYSAYLDLLIKKFEKSGNLVDIKAPLLKLGSDEITVGIETEPKTLYVHDKKADIPKVYKNILNISTKQIRKEECTIEVEFTNVDGSKIETSVGKLNLGSNDEKNIFAVYKETLGIYTLEIAVSSKPAQDKTQNSSDANNSNQNATQGSNTTGKAGKTLTNEVKGNSVEEIYKNFLKTKKYKEYTSKQKESWKKYNSSSKKFVDADVERYAILDINKDGTPELLCEASQDDFSREWVWTLIVTYDKSKNQLILVADIYSYCSLKYNSVNKTVQYSSVRPNNYIVSVESYRIDKNTLKPYMLFGYDTSGTEGGGGYDAVYIVENVQTGKKLNCSSKEEVSNEIMKNTSDINYLSISNL